MVTILLNHKTLKTEFDKSILENISWFDGIFSDHQEVAKSLKNKNPYTITVILDNLKPELRNRKEYVRKTKYERSSQYRELLFEMFFEEYGDNPGNELFGQWLDKHQRDDEAVIKHELEPRYRQKILARFKNHERLFQKRFWTDRERYYHLPEPLNSIDWRMPFDNLFIWTENGQKIARRGGSSSSGARETNSIFGFGLMDLNKIHPVPSYLFLYSDENKLFFIRKFNRLCLPDYGLGENYLQITNKGINRLKKGTLLFRWDSFDRVNSIEFIQLVQRSVFDRDKSQGKAEEAK